MNFNFNNGYEDWNFRTHSDINRVFGVRAGRRG
jgi:hypothetical protein